MRLPRIALLPLLGCLLAPPVTADDTPQGLGLVGSWRWTSERNGCTEIYSFDADADRLIEGIDVPADCPPTYIVHTHDDRSSSLGAVLFYVGLKKHNIPAELHVYGNGGHGYGLRPRDGSQISSWPDHAAHWLGTQGLLKQ